MRTALTVTKKITTEDIARDFVAQSKGWAEPLVYPNEEGLIVAITNLLEETITYVRQTDQHNLGEDRRS